MRRYSRAHRNEPVHIHIDSSTVPSKDKWSLKLISGILALILSMLAIVGTTIEFVSSFSTKTNQDGDNASIFERLSQLEMKMNSPKVDVNVTPPVNDVVFGLRRARLVVDGSCDSRVDGPGDFYDTILVNNQLLWNVSRSENIKKKRKEEILIPKALDFEPNAPFLYFDIQLAEADSFLAGNDDRLVASDNLIVDLDKMDESMLAPNQQTIYLNGNDSDCSVRFLYEITRA